MHCTFMLKQKNIKTSCTAFVSGKGVSEGELFMTEVVYNNTISLNFLEGGWVESEHSLITPPPSFLCRLLDQEGDGFKKTDQNLACNGSERRHFFASHYK